MTDNTTINTDLSKTDSSFKFIFLINLRFKLSDIAV